MSTEESVTRNAKLSGGPWVREAAGPEGERAELGVLDVSLATNNLCDLEDAAAGF